MARQIPWLRIAAEGAVIVASILLALAADAAWDRRAERAEEQEILRGLLSDVHANREELADAMRVHEVFDSLSLQLDEMSAAEARDLTLEERDAYVRRTLPGAPGTFDVQDGTLDGVLASGKLGLITDPVLRRMLVAWKSDVEDAEEEAAGLRDAASQISQRVVELGGPWRPSSPTPRVVNYPALVEATARRPPPDLAIPAEDSVLLAHFRERRQHGFVYRLALLPLVERADSLLTLVEANIR